MSTFAFKMPKHACNAHLHIIDPAFPNDGKAAAQVGTVETYHALAEAFDLERAVFVQAKPFACDNSCLVDAIEKFGAVNARGIAVTKASISDAELIQLHESGVRGLRFSVWNPANAVVSFEDCFPLSERVKDMGWNMQLHMSASQLLINADIIRSIKSKIVIDHMGRPDPQLGVHDPAYTFLCELLDRGNVWVKLSGPYLNTCTGEPWEDANSTARALSAFAPERVVWGSDFPHVTEKVKPNAAMLVEQIAAWLPSERSRQLALSDNPAELYGF